jgi:hypothetical protein
MRALRIAVLTALGAGGTVLLGWWTLVVVGALRGLPVLPRRGAAVEAAVAGGLAWAVLLGWSALRGPVWQLAQEVAPIFGLPPWMLPTTTLVFAIVAAGSAALAVREAMPAR